MADTNDIATDVSLQEDAEARWKSALYLYDQHEGGVGYAEKIYERLDDALRLCRDVMSACPCQGGCPACVPPLPPGVDNVELTELLVESDASMACTRSLLNALLDGAVQLPQITVVRRPREAAVEAPGEDPDLVRLTQRLGRAAGILRQKRERLH
jgi:ATP-dependent helicase YprA (DUF1998 family)